jgi:hypothetical protein
MDCVLGGLLHSSCRVYEFPHAFTGALKRRIKPGLREAARRTAIMSLYKLCPTIIALSSCPLLLDIVLSIASQPVHFIPDLPPLRLLRMSRSVVVFRSKTRALRRPELLSERI